MFGKLPQALSQKCNSRTNSARDDSRTLERRPDSDRSFARNIPGQSGVRMRLGRANIQVSQSEGRKTQGDKNKHRKKSLLTPARSAALDALEREFQEFLTARAS
jgi:hypothetical protein